MRSIHLRFGAALLLMVSTTPLHAAQGPAAAPRPVPAPTGAATQARDAEPPRPAEVNIAFPEREWRRDVVRIGSSFTLAADDAAGDLVMIGGTVTVEGRVAGDVVVVVGHAHIADSALIDGSLVVVGGSATIADGARIRRDLVVVGGRLDAPPAFAPGGDYTVVGPQVFSERFAGIFDWLARGPLWGRLIVPGLGWVWAVVAVFYLLYLLLGVLFEKPVREIADTLAVKPFTALVVGFLVTLLVGPICLLLAVSVVGIAVIPLVVGALCAAWMLGKVATARAIGRSIAGTAEGHRVDAVRSFTIGFAIISAAYAVPVLGLITFTLLSVFALGASTLSFLASYRRESPVAARVPRAVPPDVVVPSPLMPAMAFAGGGEIPIVDEPPSTALTNGSELLAFPRAGFSERLAAGVLDLILVIVAWNVIDPIFRGNGVFALLLIYFIAFWSWKGTTVGGIICQLRIIRVDNRPIRFVDGLVRGLSSIFSLMVLGLGFLWILRDPDRQAWHDRIAGTYVVKVPRNWPI